MKEAEAGTSRPGRPAVHVETLLLVGAVFLLLVGNGPFWRAMLAGRHPDQLTTWAFAAATFTSIASFYIAALCLFATRWTVRPLLAVLFVVTASASYYMERYTVYLDRAMVANILATNYKEARELFSWGMAVDILLFGVLPAALLWLPRLKRRSLGRAIAARIAWIVGAVLIGVVSLLPVFADFASLMRNHKEIRHLLTPGNAVASLAGNIWGRAKRPNQPKIVVGADAKQGAGAAAHRPRLFVLVIGETARAQNFSLNGYARETNPELAKRGVINFPRATSCGTSTEVSVPCMFSPYGRARYDEDAILSHESVLHVLARAGVQVRWRDNQSGCKGVCDGLAVDQMDHATMPAFCKDGQCLDEVLLDGMDRIVKDTKGNLVVVMHQLGSHGPAYFRRYPPELAKFKPACETDELRLCESAQIVNAYDNSLLYTDFFLGRVIDFLQRAQQTHDTAMLYVSDHGESLGEGGLYLHGVPYAIAPEVQTHVPFVVWSSPAFDKGAGLDAQCLRTRASSPVSHDNLFHSLLGVMDVQTSVYDAKQDIFAGCRSAVSAGATPSR